MDKPFSRKRLRELQKPDRMLALSDGVIAVAITLLVLDLKVPTSAKGAHDGALLRDLIAMMPSFSIYVLSFLVVGFAWLSHYRKFTRIHHVDGAMLWLNLIFLMTVALVPFVTAVQSQSQTRTAVILYSGTLCLVMALSAAMSAYAIRRPEIFDVDTPLPVRRRLLLSPALSAVVFAISAVVAFFDISWSRYALLLLWPAAHFAGSSQPEPAAID